MASAKGSSRSPKVKCENCQEKDLERAETEEGFAWVCPRYARAKQKGKGCGVVITEQQYAEMRMEIEEAAAEHAAAENAQRLAQVCPTVPA
jgi:hypothetical protein